MGFLFFLVAFAALYGFIIMSVHRCTGQPGAVPRAAESHLGCHHAHYMQPGPVPPHLSSLGTCRGFLVSQPVKVLVPCYSS